MNKAVEYAQKVMDGTLVAPSQVRKACENFMLEYTELQHLPIEDYEYYWNVDIENDVYNILNCLNFARGHKAGQPIGESLALWQWFLLLNIFCWKNKKTDRRKIKEVIVCVARKNSKSVLAVLVHLIAFMLDGEFPSHYLASNTMAQATIVFDEMSSILKASPLMLELFDVQKTKIDFTYKNGKLRVLSGDSRRQDGISPWVCTIDEIGASNLAAGMVNSLRTGQGAVKEPIRFLISTAYGIINSTNYWKTVVEDMADNTFAFGKDGYVDSKFGLAYLIDNARDKIRIGIDEYGEPIEIERWEQQETWLESNPLAAEVPELYENLLENYETTKNIPVDFHEFRIKNLNIWLQSQAESDEYFVDLNTLQQYKCPEIASWDWWKGKQKVMIGIDLSLRRDNTSVTFMWHDAVNNKTYFKAFVVYPKSMEVKKTQAEGIEYGRLTRTTDWCYAMGNEAVDYQLLGEKIVEIVTKYNIGVASVFYDRTYSMTLLDYLRDKFPMEISPTVVEQNSRVLGPIVSDMQGHLYEGHMAYAPNTFIESSFTNGKLEYRLGKPYIIKTNKDRNKVDTLFSTFNAYKGVMHYKQKGWYDGESKLSWRL